MPIPKKLLDELLESVKTPEDLTGPDGVLNELTSALVNRLLEVEVTEHLGYEKHDPAGRGTGNSRNGKSSKSVRTARGKIQVDVPRDREGSFEPRLIRKRQTRFEGFDKEVLSLYGRGMTVRDIKAHLEELYGVEVSPDLISSATDAVHEEIQAWRSRPLQAIYPIVILDAIVLKVRDQGSVRNKSAYVALGIDLDGYKDALGIWIEDTEGAKLWLNILTELKNRGVDDILIACCDGLRGFPDAIEAAFPQAIVQTCIVHMIRNSLRYVSWKERKRMARELKPIYTADTRKTAESALEAFEAEWGERYPQIVRSWRTNWERVVPFLDFPPSIRKVVYTTNGIESVNAGFRKVINPRGHFPTDEAAFKVLYLAMKGRTARWTRPVRGWREALQHLSLYFEGRIPL